MRRLRLGICGVALLLSSQAYAQREERLRMRAPDALRPGRITLQVGGGYANFTENGTKDLTSPGGLWTVRASAAANRWLGVEIGYVGTANGFQSPTAGDASVVRTGVDLIGKVGYPVEVGMAFVAPYGLIGVGGDLFALAGEEGDLAGVDNTDMVFTLPIGVGLMGGLGRYSLDARFEYRPAFGDEMFEGGNRTIYTAGSNSLAATLAAGYSF